MHSEANAPILIQRLTSELNLNRIHKLLLLF